MRDEEEVEGEEEYEEEEPSEEEVREPITHCVHRLPFKKQRVNIDLFYDVVEVLKTPESLARKRQSGVSLPEQLKKIGFIANLFKNEENKEDNKEPSSTRFLTFYESRLLVMQEASA